MPEGPARHVRLTHAYSDLARDDEAVAVLLDAEVGAPQFVRGSVAVHKTVRALQRRARRRDGGSALIGLAERCRVLQ